MISHSSSCISYLSCLPTYFQAWIFVGISIQYLCSKDSRQGDLSNRLLLLMYYFTYLILIVDFTMFHELPSFHYISFVRIWTFKACIYLHFNIIRFRIALNFVDKYFSSFLLLRLHLIFYLIYLLLIVSMFQCFLNYLIRLGYEWNNCHNLFDYQQFFLGLQTAKGNLTFQHQHHLLHCML